MCIGKKFHKSSASIALATIIQAMARSARLPADDERTPNAKAIIRALDRLKSATTRALVGAPMAKSSLTAWSA